MVATLNIPEDEMPDKEKLNTLPQAMFFEEVYQIWWLLGATASELTYSRVAILVGRKARDIRTYYENRAWGARRDKELGSDKEKPGRWLIGKLKYDRNPPKKEITSTSIKSLSKHKPTAIDKKIQRALIKADPETKEGILAIIDGAISSFKEGLVDGAIKVRKVVDFQRLVQLKQEIVHGKTVSSGNITFQIVTAVPRSENSPVITIGDENTADVIDAEYTEVANDSSS